MPIYEYKAFNTSGKNITGIVDADSIKSARMKLRSSGVYITEVREDSRVKGLKGEKSFSLLFSQIKPQEISLMTRQLSTLIGAGLPIVGSLGTLAEQTENPSLKKIITNVRGSVNEGTSLAESLGAYPKYFSNIFVNMIKAGEAGGALDIVLLRLAEFLEKQVTIRNKVKAALAYPVIMLVIGSLVLFFLLAYVVPIVTRMFTETNATLPLPTTILISVSAVIQHWWWLIILAIIVSFVMVRKYSLTISGRYQIDKLKLNVPIAGVVVKKTAIARFTRTLGILLKSGIPILKAFDIVEAIVENVVIADAIHAARENIKEGEDIASQLKLSGLFPPIVIHMIAVGEKSGNLEDMLLKISDTYEGEVEISIQGLTSLLEPLMIVGMGIAVGFIVLAILLPIFEMNSIIR